MCRCIGFAFIQTISLIFLLLFCDKSSWNPIQFDTIPIHILGRTIQVCAEVSVLRTPIDPNTMVYRLRFMKWISVTRSTLNSVIVAVMTVARQKALSTCLNAEGLVFCRNRTVICFFSLILWCNRISLPPFRQMPLYATLPHFYKAEQLLHGIASGLNPNKEEHGIEMMVEMVSMADIFPFPFSLNF